MLALALAGSGTSLLLQRQPPAFNLLLVLFSRPLLGACISVLLVEMLKGRCVLLARFLSSGAWTPLARLSYSAYLLQFKVIMPLGGYYFSMRGVDSELVAVSWYILYLVMATAGSFGLSLIAYLLVEKPVINIRPAG